MGAAHERSGSRWVCTLIMEDVGIILAGGNATRLRPVTTVVSKQLLPVYDKPVVYYPLTTLILGGFRKICLISSPAALPLYEDLFGDGSNLGIEINYIIQPKPDGLASAFMLAEKQIKKSNSALILGDNLFHGPQFGHNLIKYRNTKGAQIFAYAVENPEEFGVVTFNEQGEAQTLEEKPNKPKSNWAIPGFYFYDESVCERVRKLKPSSRGEYEITDLNRTYLEDGSLRVEKIPRGTAWLDLGTPDGLLDAGEYVRTLQKRQGVPIGSPEEAAWRMGYLSQDKMEKIIESHPNPVYRQLLRRAIAFS
jgi:glucose-1-phosphate thymidylyltransferase